MNATKITDGELNEAKVASLPTRPTSPASYGGRGYTAAEMKEAFDRLPMLLAERYNLLLDDISALGDGSLANSVPTGLFEEHTLSDLFGDIESGNLASYLKVGDKTLYSILNRLMTAVFGEGI
ncbi:MAG: hypothetical protein IKC34_00830 [Clostridia bacterium]|nr:hypothetical protein [Clostridia bacterium]